MPRKIKGLRLHGAGYETYVRVNGVLRSERWPRDTPISEMTDWIKAQRGQQSRIRAGHKTLAKDADTYLEKVRALPTYAQRVTHLALWVAVFGTKRRSTITSADIRGQRDRWLLSGLAPHTVNLRLRALSNLWTVLDGRRAKNPVRDVPEATEPDPEPRALPYWLAQRIVDRVRAPLEHAQAQMMIALGLSPVELSRLLSRHRHGATLFVQGRRKGQGGASRSIPLSDAGSAALDAFSAARGWGRLPSKQFYRVLRRACLSVAEDPLTIDSSFRERIRQVRAYDLRHTYATALYGASGDAHAAAHILGHRSTSTTQRYIAAALAERTAKAVQSFAQEVGRESWQDQQAVEK
jgi:site-specific recombinase XerC